MIASAELHTYALPLVQPVVTARATAAERTGWLVCLRDDAGHVGWGEAACWPGFGAGPEATERALQRLIAEARGRPTGDLDAIRSWDLPRTQAPEASHAVELAAFDLLAQGRGVPLAALLADAPRERLSVSVLVCDADHARAACQAGARSLKVKVGARPVQEDAARLFAIQTAGALGSELRLDANGAWTAEQAVRALRVLRGVSPSFVEQPTPPGDWEALAAVCRGAGVPIAVDEGLRSRADLERAAAAGAAVCVLKPMALGGLLAAKGLAEVARGLGLRCVVSHLLETAVGRAGALHLAAALTDELPVGLSSPLADDVAPLATAGGALELPRRPGLGVVPRFAASAAGETR